MEAFDYVLEKTTQGPAYPPSEIFDQDGNFVVVGMLNLTKDNQLYREWGAAIVSSDSPTPQFGEQLPYQMIRSLDLTDDVTNSKIILHTLPLPLPCHNYPMTFAPEQKPDFNEARFKSLPLHQAYIPDFKSEYGKKFHEPITLKKWLEAAGNLTITLSPDRHYATFDFQFSGLIPNTLYTVMALREHDLHPQKLTRPMPLGIPNVLIPNHEGKGQYQATLPNPFPRSGTGNRVINVVLLWMSSQMNYGGAIGHYGLGAEIHAQLKFKQVMFSEIETV